MARKYAELRAKMSPEAQAKARRLAQEMRAAMLPEEPKPRKHPRKKAAT